MNIEITVKEENDAVKITVISPDKPVVMETVTSKRSAGAAVPATPCQKETATSEPEAGTSEAEQNTVSALSEKIAAMNREYERVKKAAWRAQKRLEATLQALGQTVSAVASHCPTPAVAGCPTSVPVAAPCSAPRVPEACYRNVPPVPEPCPGDNLGQGTENTAYTHTCNTKTISNTKSVTMSHQVMSHKASATTNTMSTEPAGNGLPFVPAETARRFIPLAKLPEMYRNIVTAWNQLPLRSKLKGLYPDVAQKLHSLLKEFGEASLHKAIRMAAESPFLLGKSSGGSGWVISFGWLLKPGNLQKVLDDKYRNREPEWGQNYYGAHCPEYTPWTDAETCYLDPGVMTEGVTTLNEQTRNCLEQTAKLLGLKKEDAA